MPDEKYYDFRFSVAKLVCDPSEDRHSQVDLLLNPFEEKTNKLEWDKVDLDSFLSKVKLVSGFQR